MPDSPANQDCRVRGSNLRDLARRLRIGPLFADDVLRSRRRCLRSWRRWIFSSSKTLLLKLDHMMDLDPLCAIIEATTPQELDPPIIVAIPSCTEHTRQRPNRFAFRVIGTQMKGDLLSAQPSSFGLRAPEQWESRYWLGTTTGLPASLRHVLYPARLTCSSPAGGLPG